MLLFLCAGLSCRSFLFCICKNLLKQCWIMAGFPQMVTRSHRSHCREKGHNGRRSSAFWGSYQSCFSAIVSQRFQAGIKRDFVSEIGAATGKKAKKMARETGLEPATSTVTGWHSNQLSYSPAFISGVDAWKNSVSLSTLYNITPFGCFANVFLKKSEFFVRFFWF